jgi:deoxyribodipyrimidine photolyase-related protein
MKTIRLVLGDQLTHSIATLDDIDPRSDVVLMAELAEETGYVPHHKQKLVFILSAMRHFAAELIEAGVAVDYVRLDDAANTGSFTGEVARAVKRHGAGRVIATMPGEWRVLDAMRNWQRDLGIPVELREDDRFFCSTARFNRWAAGRSSLRMEFFYREMRRETGLLMRGDQPEGGSWNFDADNRQAWPRGRLAPARQRFVPDGITAEVIELVSRRFDRHFGDLDGFGWAVTRQDALRALDHFVADCLPSFGDYQDAMKTGAPFLYHAVLSPYLNIGLLTARELCDAAEAAWRGGHAPLNAVEGFIRQILGWREYVRGIYWRLIPKYADSNALDANRPLPEFYWSGRTDLNCVAQVVAETRAHAYAHHIQRLMITGNFALLAGIAPHEVEAWYLAVYADAYEWVELPNTHGMALFADGGVLASKPYAASGAYIDRMSDYCAQCRFDPKIKLGPAACPFNYLYWNFLITNRDRLAGNPRLAMPYRTLGAMPADRRAEIVAQSAVFLNGAAPRRSG